MKNTNEIKPLTITDGLDVFQAHALIDTLSGYEGTEAAIYAIEDWAAENAVAFAIKYANEGNADDAAALLEIYDGDGEDDDNWADVITAIDRARTAEWAGRNWLEIKTRTVPVTSEENLHEIERAAAISGLTVTDYGVDDDGRPTNATIMGTADDIKVLDQLAAHFNHAPANEEPARTCQTIEADDKKAEDLENIAIRRGFDVTIICNTNAGGYTTSADLIGPEADVSALLRAYEREEATRPAPRDQDDAHAAVDEYLGCPEGEFLKEILEEAAEDVRKDPTNIFKAGYFEGMTRMLAAAIVNDGANKNESVATITRAAYDYCGVAW